MAQQQWGVDGYGSMKGLIRLRASSPRHPGDAEGDDDDSSSGSDVEEHVEVERRLDHDLSRFEMVYPGGMANGGAYVFEDDQDVHVARLEEENLTLKERLFLMEQEVGDMRRRLEAIEARFAGADGAAAAGSADNAALVLQKNAGAENAVVVLQQRANADAENALVENGVDAAAVAAGDAVIESLENSNAIAAGAENANLLEKEKVDAASASDDTVEDALKNDTEMDVATSASANVVADALKNDTEMADAGNLVEDAMVNVAAVADVVTGADNAVKESDITTGDVEQEKSVEDMAGAGSEKNAEMADTTGSGEEEGKEQA
ncbi:unnamed protein product [Triticum turgidum subsp. durum]|uniref:PRLI-interacting factor A n=1 Tax=Triticum turgidum subsp. durum TaxID=4567 RepID=A0A9R0YY44_TRITD|nr:unnamed protein product [Triticum turgidum subsp. durum]